MEFLWLLFLLTLAALKDTFTDKIDNRLIMLGWLTGLGLNIIDYGFIGVFYTLTRIALPIFLFSPIFALRMLGAGDIKLFSVISCFYGWEFFRILIICSFSAAAIQSLLLLIRERNLAERLNYLYAFFSKKHPLWRSYLQVSESKVQKRSTIHFSISILAGFLISCIILT